MNADLIQRQAPPDARGRALVAVVPPREHERRCRLLAALEHAFPVRFEGRDADHVSDADAVLAIAADEAAVDGLRRAGRDTLVACAGESAPPAGARPEPFALAHDAALDRRLHGAVLGDPAALRAASGGLDGRPLAGSAAGPLWTTETTGAARYDSVAVAPAELTGDETLRARLEDGRALALLPLVHFLRRLTADRAPTPPPLRAAFLIDDPNLHWTSYGHLRYRELVRHADRHDYHVAMAMVPLDARISDPRADALFRAHRDRLSLLVHGNDHTLQELAQPLAADGCRALLAQALRRVAAFERRTGLEVSRVMAAPHGDCSQTMAREMARLGFDALCIDRPYPWAARVPHSWLTRPAASSVLDAFAPSTVIAGGLPVVLRRPFDLSAGDLALRAFLDQPLVVYGHHEDFADGLDRFADWAARINALGPVRWTSLDEIARSNEATRVEGTALRVLMHGRRASVDVPAGVESIVIELPPGHDPEQARVTCGARSGAPGEPFALAPGASRVDVAVTRRDAVAPDAVAAPAPRLRPLARRVAGESRDRLLPLYRRAARARRSKAPTS